MGALAVRLKSHLGRCFTGASIEPRNGGLAGTLSGSQGSNQSRCMVLQSLAVVAIATDTVVGVRAIALPASAVG